MGNPQGAADSVEVKTSSGSSRLDEAAVAFFTVGKPFVANSAQNHQMPTAEINMTHQVPVDLPRASSTPTPEKPMTLQVSIDAENQIFVGNSAVDRNNLETHFRDAVAQDAKVEMHLRADRITRYEAVAETMSAARRAGLSKIGFVTQPGSAPL